jgi:hypothetical protein
MRSLPPLAALAVALLTPAAAHASIVSQRSIAGVHLRMSEAGVRHVLGKPAKAETIPDEIQGHVRHLDYGKTDVYLSVTADGTVYSITTTDRRQKTSTGVGVGSTERQVRRGVRGVRCEGSAALRLCTVGTATPGRRVTQFIIGRTGKVRRVTLGFVID